MINKFKLQTRALLAALLVPGCLVFSAQAMSPFKDRLFQYGQILESRDNGHFQIVSFRAKADVNGRDEIPGQQARPTYVDLAPLEQQRAIQVPFKTDANETKELEAYEVGSPKDAKFAVIFIHGSGGNKELGVKDWTFGGNFNRIKNLAVRNRGVYYSPSVNFDNESVSGVQALIDRIKAASPDCKIVVAGASAGAYVLWGLAHDKHTASQISGLIFLAGAVVDESYENTPAFAHSVPIFIAHGNKDPVVPAEPFEQLYERLKVKNRYPVRMIIFDSGAHGTPMRMLDWKKTLEWMLQGV